MSGIKDVLTIDARSPRGMGLLAFVDAMILLILGLMNIFMNRSIGGMSVGVSSIIWFVLAIILAVGGYFFIKGSMNGFWIGWIGAIAAIIIGIVFCFKMVDNNSIGGIYALLTGIINAVILLYPSTRQDLR